MTRFGGTNSLAEGSRRSLTIDRIGYSRALIANACVLLVILVLAAALRLYRLDDESLWYDEVVSVQVLDAQTFAGFLEQERVLDPAIVPLYFFLEYQWWHHVSASEYGLRIFSVILGLATIVTVWWLGTNIFSPKAGAIAALCTAFAVNQIYYSQEIRMYALMYLLAALSTLALERALAGQGRLVWWMGHWLASALLVWTHLFGTLVLVAHGLAVLWIFRRRIRVVFIWAAGQTIYLLPLVWWILRFPEQGIDEHLAWVPLPTVWALSDTFWTVLTGTEYDATRGFLPKTARAMWTHALGAVLWFCIGWRIWCSTRTRAKTENSQGCRAGDAPGTVLLYLWCAVPVLLIVILSWTVRPCFVERYFGHCALPLFVLAGGGIDAMPSHWIRRATTLLILSGFIIVTAQSPRPLRADLRSAVAIIERESVGDEICYMRNRFESGLAFQYYTSLDESRVVMGENYQQRAIRRVKNGQPTWFLIVGSKREARQFRTVSNNSNLKLRRYTFRGRRTVRLRHAFPNVEAPRPGS